MSFPLPLKQCGLLFLPHFKVVEKVFFFFVTCESCGCHRCHCGGIVVFGFFLLLSTTVSWSLSIGLASPSSVAVLSQTLSFWAFFKLESQRITHKSLGFCFLFFLFRVMGRRGFSWCSLVPILPRSNRNTRRSCSVKTDLYHTSFWTLKQHLIMLPVRLFVCPQILAFVTWILTVH